MDIKKMLPGNTKECFLRGAFFYQSVYIKGYIIRAIYYRL